MESIICFGSILLKHNKNTPKLYFKKNVSMINIADQQQYKVQQWEDELKPL